MLWGLGLKAASWFLGGGVTSILTPLTNAYTAKINAGTDAEKMAAELAAKQLVLDQREAELQAGLAKGEPGYVRQLFAYPVALYFAKCFAWDKVLGLGATDPLDERLFWVAQTIIISYFGSRVIKDVVAQFRSGRSLNLGGPQ